MKKMVIVGAILSRFIVQAQADDSGLCKSVSELAFNTAQARYAGVPIYEVMDIVKEKPEVFFIVEMAYQLPDYQGEEMQYKASREFSNETYLSCIKAAKQ